MHVHRAGFTDKLIAPHLMQQIFPRHHHAGMPQKGEQQFIFHVFERDHFTALRDGAAFQVYGNIPIGKLLRLFVRPGQHLLHSHQKFQDVKGFHEVILRPQPQSLHPALHVCLCRNIDHRDSFFLHIGQQLKAVQFGQHNIAQGQIETLSLYNFHRLPSIHCTERLVAGQHQVCVN